MKSRENSEGGGHTRRDLWIYAIVGAIVLVVVIGGLHMGPMRPEASSEVSDDGTWSIHYDGTSGYDATLIDNGSRSLPGTVYVYDGAYGSPYEGTYDTADFLRSFRINLDALGVEYETVDAEELGEIMASPGAGKAVVMFSGAMPDTVYDGTSDSKIVGWVSSGGTLYWAAHAIGDLIAHEDGSLENVAGSVGLFTGAESVCPGGFTDSADSDGWWHVLRLKNRGMNYALPSDCGLAMGFQKDGYSSVVLCAMGDGQVCCVSGALSPELRADLATVVASGVTSSSVLVDHREGTVTRETVSGGFDIPSEHGNLTVVLRLNGYDPVYGRTVDIKGVSARTSENGSTTFSGATGHGGCCSSSSSYSC